MMNRSDEMKSTIVLASVELSEEPLFAFLYISFVNETKKSFGFVPKK